MSPLHESIPAPLTCYGVILPLNCERVLFGLDFNVVTKTILKYIMNLFRTLCVDSIPWKCETILEE